MLFRLEQGRVGCRLSLAQGKCFAPVSVPGTSGSATTSKCVGGYIARTSDEERPVRPPAWVATGLSRSDVLIACRHVLALPHEHGPRDRKGYRATALA